MKKTYIIGNWKSNKTNLEATEWLTEISNFTREVPPFQISNKEVVVCPPFTLLPLLKSYFLDHKSKVKLGAQDISPFAEGAYTGEVNGKQLKELVYYVIIGHSERRKHFGETDEIISQKVARAVENGLTPILCVSEITQVQNVKIKMQNYNAKFKIKENKLIIAYEPLFAIGSGTPDTPENADKTAAQIKKEIGDLPAGKAGVPIIYGGSVKADNVKSFTSMEHIAGVLVGGASLDASEFAKIIENA